ncbi:MAG: hypothetical protein E7456_04230 [Ruminococcaceae bacterium]|nr:hypothetical protein [Oscillospiraceae bacterium]
MKKNYIAPSMEVELFELDASIAANCEIIVSNGPAIGIHSQCHDYVDPFASAFSARTINSNVNFYEDTTQVCDCYTTGGAGAYWTS